jgi:NADH-quinone oxidoreductase subunit L
MTSFYMFRLLFLTFFGKFRGTHDQEHHLHESPASMTVPLMILAVLSALGGFIGVPEALHGTHHLAEFMSPLYEGSRQVNPEAFLPTTLTHSEEYILMAVSVGVALLSLIVAYVMYVQKESVPAPDSEEKSAIQNLVYNKYYVDELYNAVFVKPIKLLSTALYSFGEFFIDLFVDGTARLVRFLGGLLRKTQTGSTGDYVFAMVLGIVVILFWKLLL